MKTFTYCSMPPQVAEQFDNIYEQVMKSTESTSFGSSSTCLNYNEKVYYYYTRRPTGEWHRS